MRFRPRYLVLAYILLQYAGLGISQNKTFPDLSSRLQCGCRDSHAESKVIDLQVRTMVERSPQGWMFKYEFDNHADDAVRFMMYWTEDENVQFLAPLQSIEGPNPGASILVVPAHTTLLRYLKADMT